MNHTDSDRDSGSDYHRQLPLVQLRPRILRPLYFYPSASGLELEIVYVR